MSKVIFGSACMITGMLLVLVMLCLAHFQNAYEALTFLGKCVVWGGIGLSLFGVGYCLWNME